MRSQAILRAYCQGTYRHSGIKIESHSEDLTEIRKSTFTLYM
jgi:hypothetical protein